MAYTSSAAAVGVNTVGFGVLQTEEGFVRRNEKGRSQCETEYRLVLVGIGFPPAKWSHSSLVCGMNS